MESLGSDLSLVCVCTDRYPVVYAEKLVNRFKSVTELPLNYYCITDRPEQVGDWANPIEPSVKSVGWWNKVNLFDPSLPGDWLIYLDLDIIICDQIDTEIAHTIRKGYGVNCVSDAIGWMGEKFSSSFMILKKGVHSEIFEAFEKQHEALIDRPGGDQVWLGPQLSEINFIDDDFPNLKRNLKFHLGTRSGSNLSIPANIPENIKMVDCGGRPKPHELIGRGITYADRFWGEVPCSSYINQG